VRAESFLHRTGASVTIHFHVNLISSISTSAIMSASDVEKGVRTPEVQDVDSGSGSATNAVVGEVEDVEYLGFARHLHRWTAWTHAEERGAQPVPVEQRTQTDYLSIFTVFGTPMTSLLP
jgi:hypothetical protein